MSVQTRDLGDGTPSRPAPVEEQPTPRRGPGSRERLAPPPAAPVAPPAPPAEGPNGVVGHGPAPTPATAPSAPADAPRPRRRLARVIVPIVLVILVAAAFFGFNAWRNSQLFVSTDNAGITGQPVQVGSMNAGRVDAVFPAVGSLVHKGDVVAQVALPSQIGTGQNGTPKMGFLGAGDTRVDVAAPFDGVVIATPVGQGATVQVGQAIVTLIDPTQLWVNANVEETNIGRVKPGQTTTVHVDSLNADVPGRVESVTPATAAVFSLIPTNNASGNFNKVTQLVPVRISLNLGSQPALLGTSVEVKIRVAD